MVRVLLFGSGSVGTVYAMLLHKAGAEVTCVCRSNLEAAKSNGFTVKSSIFGEHSFAPTVVASAQEAAEIIGPQPFDFLVVCTKGVQRSSSDLTQLLRPAIQENHTSVVVIQNGIGMEQSYCDAFPQNTIISGVTYLPTTQISPTVVSHTETQILHLGIFPAGGATPSQRRDVEAFAQLLRVSGGQATVHADVQIERWKKLIGNTTWNPICALSRCRDLEFLQASDLASTFTIKAMQEVVAVAHALGYREQIQATAVDIQVKRSAARTWPGVEPSMMADMIHRRSMEVEPVIGAVVKLARAHSVDVPRLESLYVLLSGLDWSLQQTQR